MALIANIHLSSPLILSVALVWLLLVSAIIYLTYRARKTRKKLAASESDRTKITKGRKQVLDFLHHLGVSTQQDQSTEKLHEVIVNGVTEVTNATGGALYLLDESGKSLYPAYVSDQCAQLTVDAEKTEVQLDQHVTNMTFRVVISNKKGILGEAYNSQKLICTDALENHTSFTDEYSGSGSAMVIPLIHAEKAIGVLAVTKPAGHPPFPKDAQYTFSKVSQQSAFALGNHYAHTQMAEKRRLEEELQNANQVQSLLLPSEEPQLETFNLFGYNIAAKQVSGDYYDYIDLPNNKTGVIIADVSGKGMPAGLIMATFRSALRSIATELPSESLSLLNRIIYPDIRDDMFISAIYATLDNTSGKVTLARAGHNPPYYYCAETGEIQKIKSPGLAVGIDDGNVFESIIKDYEVNLHPGDKLFLYTDGIIEAFNKHEQQFTPKRLEKVLLKHGSDSAEELGNKILSALAQFVRKAPASDDITLVVIERK